MCWYKLRYKKSFLLHPRATINGVKNIQTNNKLEVGIESTGFVHRNERTLMNIRGTLVFKGVCFIGRGCRFDIKRDATMTFGKQGYVNVNTTFIVTNKMSIGDNCVISWNCQFMDSDFHTVDYEGRRKVSNEVIIGDHVWIGCGVHVYSGTVIPDNCVIAANSIVKGVFTQKNTIIAGNPAKVIKENVQWQ